MGDLVHDEIGVFEETENPVVELDADIITVLFHTEGTENKVFHPVIVNLLNNGNQIFGLDYFAEFDPGRPQEGKLVNTSDEDLHINKSTSLAYRILSCYLRTRP